jgi:hypothetical protein
MVIYRATTMRTYFLAIGTRPDALAGNRKRVLSGPVTRSPLESSHRNGGTWVGCWQDIYSKEQTGSDILVAVTLRQRSKTDMRAMVARFTGRKKFQPARARDR